MKILTRVVALAAAAMAAAALAATPALAAPAHHDDGIGARDAVFVQTNNVAGNAVVAYHRNPNGTLKLVATYPTGGVGGRLGGSVVDFLARRDCSATTGTTGCSSRLRGQGSPGPPLQYPSGVSGDG